MSINRVMISGNLTRDAEIRSTQSGMAILGFGVAVNDRRKNQQTGEWEDYPNFVDCTMFGTRGEKLQPYLTKGTKVAIEGKLRYSSWERDGQRRSKLEVIVDELEFMSSRNGNNANQGYDNGMTAGYAPQPAPMAAPVAAPIVDASASVYDEDIRFKRKRFTKCPTTRSSLVASTASSAKRTRSTSTTKILRCCASMLPTAGRSSRAA